MWLWRNKPTAPDPIGDICRMLVTRPWDWVANQTDDANPTPYLAHASGVWVTWERQTASFPNVWFGFSDLDTGQALSTSDALRVYDAIIGNAAARINAPRRNFGDTCEQLARAVLAGDAGAARALVDCANEVIQERGES